MSNISMFPDLSHIVVFLMATILLNILPGSDVLYVGSQSLYNKKQGVFAALGVSTGIGIYIIATAMGLTALLQSSIVAFNAVKIAGAIYLLYLAFQLFSQKKASLSMEENNIASSGFAYRKGIYTNILNPKVGIFFITFLPQFINPEQGHAGFQLLFLGLLFLISGTIVNLLYVFLFSQVRRIFTKKPHFQKWLDTLTGTIFCLIAAKVITSKQY